jgi:phage terminase large subunit-like protein
LLTTPDEIGALVSQYAAQLGEAVLQKNFPLYHNGITLLCKNFEESEGKALKVKEYVVETDGVFLWPRTVREDGKAFGYNLQLLSRIRAEYLDKVQFYAQYYNNPNDPNSDRISRDKFQYYNPKLLTKADGRWHYNGRKLNVYAAVDFAFSLKKGSDYTAIVVIGMDHDSNVYILDIDRFKSDRTSEYFQHIKQLHSKWRFNKLRAEVTVAQVVIVNAIKDYVQKDGMTLKVEDYRPVKKEGSKEERIAAALEHKYDNGEMYHIEGGWTGVLEEELVLSRPPHDDIKDALASAVSIATPPFKNSNSGVQELLAAAGAKRSRFGGMSAYRR